MIHATNFLSHRQIFRHLETWQLLKPTTRFGSRTILLPSSPRITENWCSSWPLLWLMSVDTCTLYTDIFIVSMAGMQGGIWSWSWETSPGPGGKLCVLSLLGKSLEAVELYLGSLKTIMAMVL